jgi:quercetin dioxygenase-like cupin family protein
MTRHLGCAILALAVTASGASAAQADTFTPGYTDFPNALRLAPSTSDPAPTVIVTSSNGFDWAAAGMGAAGGVAIALILVGSLALIRRRRMRPVTALTAAAVVGALALAAVALGSPGSGFTATNLVDRASFDETIHLNSDRIKFETKDPTDVRVQTITYAPGGRSGWHYHLGMVLAAVQAGELTVWDSSCSTKVYGPNSPNGAVFVETGTEPMQVGNTGSAPATVYATLVAPDGAPFRVETDPVSCP